MIGPIPESLRMNFYVTGGALDGPKCKGSIVPVGGDWLTIRAKWRRHPDVREDDALIYVAYSGVLFMCGDGERCDARPEGSGDVQSPPLPSTEPMISKTGWCDHTGEAKAKGRHRGCGRAVIGVEVRVVDADHKPVPPGTIGEVAIRGSNVMMGYWERPEETAKALIGGWMHTGDGGHMDEDGYFYLVDRIKDMIISGGENVYSIEVENALAEHPAVVQCAVVGIPDERWGEAVHAIVVRTPGVSVDPSEVISFCKDKIAHYKCPRSVEIRDEPLPLSGAGKILKRELRRPFWEKKATVPASSQR